ncbi:MAG: hypothetical protein ABI859_12040 [Pseudomonadota bacterium]
MNPRYRPWWTYFSGLIVSVCFVTQVAADDGTSSQHRAAEEFLAAVASGSAQNVALAIHPSELDLLRKRIVDLVKLEAERDENGVRSRLFGPAVPVTDVERMTPVTLYATISRRVLLTGRVYEDINWTAAVPDSGGMVQLVGRGRQPKDHGNVRPVVLVSLVPWGKDWKAAIPLEVQAQIDDLIAGRSRSALLAPAVSAAGAGVTTGGGNLQAIVTLLTEATSSLVAGDCADYYGKHMSPNFRRSTAAKALKTLIASCTNRPEVRDTLLAALRGARSRTPRYEYDSTRAVYDLSGEGLPFNRFVLEQVDKRWYVAE